MSKPALSHQQRRAVLSATLLRSLLRSALPGLSLLLVLVPMAYLQPLALSYFGLNLLLNLSIPLIFATLAQMFVLTIGDLDLSIGAFVGLVACLTVTVVHDAPLLGAGVLLLLILAYGAIGALVHVRNLPAIVVTLGMSFVWLGLAILVLPRPGGSAPEWLRGLMSLRPPLLPLPIVVALLVSLIVHIGLNSAYGAILRGAGGNPRAVARAGWSLLRARVMLYCLAGLFGVIAGMTLTGITTSADASIALRYTLLSIAGVILGGGEFVGGRVSPIGAVLGAMTLTLAGAFLSFLNVPPDWQIGVQGGILILILGLRALISRGERQL